MDEATFDKLAADALNDLERQLAPFQALEADFNGEVLKIELPDGSVCVVNSHRAARQIWLSAEMSASHYDFDPATKSWRDSKTKEDLRVRLSGLLGRALGTQVTLR